MKHNYKRRLGSALALLAGVFGISGLSAQVTTQTFNYTGSMQTFVVPPCVTSITIDAYGAQGANSQDRLTTNATGGLGGRAQGTLAVTPGQTLYIYVGGAGNINGAGGFNGGGNGGSSSAGSSCSGGPAAGGGGATDIRVGGTALTDRVIVAGGGGGSGRDYCNGTCQPCGCGGSGGAGGGTTGTIGAAAYNCSYGYPGGGVNGGLGGTQLAGGSGGLGDGGGPAGSAGSLGTGGNGAGGSYDVAGGGGGGGYYGGGGGGGASSGSGVGGGGGAGGSSYTGSLISASTTANVRTGNGLVILTYSTTSNLPSPTITSGNTVVCPGSTQTYSISSVPTATSYTWTVPTGSTITSGQGTTTITVTMGSNPGFITVTANNNCGSSAPTTLPIAVNPLPTVTATAASGTICAGATETLTASGAASYVWSSGGTAITETVSPSTTTTYTVTGTDANGCTNTATVTVNVNALPNVTATVADGSICIGSNDTLNAAGASTYAWSSGGSAAQEIVTPTATTTYTVTGTDVNGCANTATVTVNVNALPVVNLGTDVAQCEGTVTLDAQNSGATYAWSTGGSAQTETVTASGAYSVVVTDANGCSNSDTINVTINTNPAVNLGPDSAQCSGSIMVDAGFPGSSYLWSDNSNAQTLVVTTTGTYYVAVTDVNGCTGSDTINVTIHTPPTVTASASATTVCLDDANVTLTGTPNGGTWSGPGVTGNSFDPSVGAGTQVLTYNYTDSNGCEGFASVTVNVSACVGFAEATLASGVNLYPNPNPGTFTVAVNANVGDMVIEVMDMQGRLVFKSNENNVKAGFTKQITLENNASGMYTVRMTTANEIHVVKMNVHK